MGDITFVVIQYTTRSMVSISRKSTFSYDKTTKQLFVCEKSERDREREKEKREIDR